MAKADFDGIYVAADPRPYFRTLCQFDYQIPAHGGSVFRRLARALNGGDRPHVVDVCCSYGINAAVLKCDVSFDDVVAHYCAPALDGLERDALVDVDREWFGARVSEPGFEVTGVDCSAQAIGYAVDVGLLDAGFAENLEDDPISAELGARVDDADLIIVTGGIGYVTETTIGRLFERSDQPRLAALSLRWVDFAPIVDVGAEHGLVTERLDEATFPQRRVADEAEWQHVRTRLQELGIDSHAREEDGYHHTDLYLMRPASEVAERPLMDLLGPISGAINEQGEELAELTDRQVSVFKSGAELLDR